MNIKLKKIILVIIFLLMLFQNRVLGLELVPIEDTGNRIMNNPTFDAAYIIDLTELIIFYFILIVLLVISKVLMKKNEKSQKETSKNISKKFIIFIFTISTMYFLWILFRKESYAVMATSIYYLGLYEIMLICLGIFFTNCIITILFNDEISVKQFFCQNIIDTIYENIILTILGTIYYLTNLNYIILLIGLPIGYIILRVRFTQKNQKSGLKKLLSILIYALCLFIICIKIQPKYISSFPESGTVIVRRITKYENNYKHYNDYTNIETFKDGKLVKSNQIRKVEGNL